MIINTQPRIITRRDVMSKTTFSKSTLYNREKQGLIARPVSLGGDRIGYISNEIDTVIDAMCQEQTPDQIKALVRDLIANRKVIKGGI